MKKILSLLMITLLLVLIPTQYVSAAVKISKKKATMEIDSTLILNIAGSSEAVKWTSSKKNIATVNSKGKVTALKAGTTTITATVGKSKYTCDVTVVNSNKTSFNENLSSGEYLVGEDIPEGKYNLTCIIGAGILEVYKDQTDYEEDSYNYNSIVLAEKDGDIIKTYPTLYSYEYKNLNLKKGQYVVIDSGLSVNFSSK